ncbi:PREDICTED: muscular LMNA-interacting protein [Nipponia nippon]|uniref:muscular LMNA-interacting protein n=1 Tax=Nipponia nippon TaxID=128390 RepID=UPI0005107C41|nr:PREDICTED: muscular LMNA-interacting protein [Nipponia nippon]
MGWEGLFEEQKKRGGELGGGWWEWAWQEVPGTIIAPWGPLLPGHPRSCAGGGWRQTGRDGSTTSGLRLSLLWQEQDPTASALSRYLQVTSQESGTKPLTFTFVPSIGRLPTHFEVVDVSKFLVTIPDEPKDLSNQEIINKSNVVSDELALKSGARQDRVSAICTDSTGTAFQSLGCNSSKGEMQENDLFKAEFILITDSGDEDEVAAASNNIHLPSNGYGPISAQLLATSHVSPGTGAGKPPGDGHVPGAALSHSTADLQKHQALEEPAKSASMTEGTVLDTHSEMCSPAQLRQQTEELCAVIDQVLQDPLTMRRCESSPSFLQMSTESDVGKVSTTLQRAAGRETRYANLYKSAPMVTENQLPSHPIVPIPENETLSSKEVANERGSV